jgi:hypothetical protein
LQPAEARDATSVFDVQARADRPASPDVREVDEATLRPLRAEAIRIEPHGKDERLVPQILESRRGVG